MSLRSESSRGTSSGLTPDGNGGETSLDRSELQESAAPTGVLVTDAHERVLHAEGAAFPQHGLSTAGWRGRLIQELLPDVAVAVLMPRYRAALAGTPQAFDYRTSDGTRTYRVQIAPLRDEAGTVTSVVAVLQDTTERRHMNAELTRSETRLREAERMVGLGSWELTVGSGEITSSPGLIRLLDLDDDQLLDLQTFMGRIHPDDRAAVERAAAECRESGSAVVEYRVIWRDGTERILSTRAELVARPGDPPDQMRGAVLDVTDQREAERARLAAEHLFQQGFDAAPIGMALSDAGDGRSFRVNDALCRLVGRPPEQLIGESVLSIIHPDDREAVAAARAEMVAGRRSTFEGEIRYLRPDGAAAWGLLHVAPVHREDGSVSVFHAQVVDITERKEREARLVHDVGDAIWLGRIRSALDDGRFVLYSQPIIDLATGRAVQHELLLRMQDEDGAVVVPCEFLPVAERYGLISEIDRWVIREAVQIAATGAPTEFNLSARSVGDPSMIRELATAIEQTGADPALIVVEVTETALLGRTDVGREFAQQVRALGCRVALDDFGTGFSSLSHLKHLPADYLKIDIEFIRELSSSETDARVVRGIVGLAREFGQITVAEGVEDEGTLVRLKELGVDRAQGYLFARPAPRSALAAAASGTARRSPAPNGNGSADPVATVRAVFDAFAANDVSAMLRYCWPDIVLRPFATSRLAERSAPYRGHDGVRAYLRDVAKLWGQLTFTPLELRQTPDSVIGFGHVEARGANAMSASVLWIVHLREGQLSSIEVFQAPETDSADQTARRQIVGALRS